MYLLHRTSFNRYMFHVEDVRMNWQTSAKLVALTGVMTAMSFNAPSVTAQSKDLERTLAGVRLNASSRTVLSKFGNPNEIYIGDIGVRIPGTGAQQGGGGMGMGEDGGMAGGPGMMGGMSGGSGPRAGGSGMMTSSGPSMGGMGGGMMGSSGMMGGMAGMRGGGSGAAAGRMGGMGGGSGMMTSSGPSMGGGGGKMGSMGGGMTGAPSSMMGGMRMGGSKMGGGDGEMGGMAGGMGGMMGGMGGMMGGGDTGGAVGAFGRTQSSVARQQEVTWVYNRTTKDAKGQTTAISYEFLINPGGSISQIRCLGYHSPMKPTTQTPSITTQKGIRLGSSYVEILRAYGQPDSYEKSGNILVLSYPKKHVQFQLINQQEQAEPTKAAYRVIAMTIATVEG